MKAMKLTILTLILALLVGIELAEYSARKSMERDIQRLTMDVGVVHAAVISSPSDDLFFVLESLRYIHEEMEDLTDKVSKGIKVTCPHDDELITVYTSQDILYLKGRTITSESGNVNATFPARNIALEVLAQMSADQSNPEYH